MKVLISSRSFGKINPRAIKLLKEEGLDPVLNPYGRKLNEKELLNLIDGAIAIIAGTENITAKVISDANQLKVISRYGGGLDNIDLKTAHEKGILVFNTPDTPTIAVAELTLSLILNLLKKISKVDRDIRGDLWKPEIGNLLSGKTVGTIGLGRIGKKLVQLLTPFNVNILAYEIKPDKAFVTNYNIDLVTLNTLLHKSEIVTIHVPLTEQTRHIIGKKELTTMKENAILINTARGGLVDEKALYDSITNGMIAGAAIDTFEEEPYMGKLKELDNVILTPHIGTYTVETRKHMEIEAAKNLIKGLREAKIL